MRVSRLSLAMSVVLSACAYDASFEDCTIHCSATTGCPDDLTCGAEGLCREPGETTTCAMGDGNFLSCTGLPATCGSDGDDDCCSIATPIPGGTFYRSYDVATDEMYSDMNYPATVSPFELNKYEVTVGRFRKFVEAGGGTQVNPPVPGAGAHEKIPSSGWDADWDIDLAPDTVALGTALLCDPQYQTWTATAGVNEDLPINCVTWYEAEAFCAWDGGYLPTEAEWNFAAAGGDEQRAYPWSNPAPSTEINCAITNYGGTSWPSTACISSGVNPVGSESPQGDGVWGQSDLGGNVWEWTLDELTPYTDPCNDCASLLAAEYRVVRGGPFAGSPSDLRTAYRGPDSPTARRSIIGVRCSLP